MKADNTQCIYIILKYYIKIFIELFNNPPLKIVIDKNINNIINKNINKYINILNILNNIYINLIFKIDYFYLKLYNYINLNNG